MTGCHQDQGQVHGGRAQDGFRGWVRASCTTRSLSCYFLRVCCRTLFRQLHLLRTCSAISMTRFLSRTGALASATAPLVGLMAEKWFGFKGDASRSRVPGQVGQYLQALFFSQTLATIK